MGIALLRLYSMHLIANVPMSAITGLILATLACAVLFYISYGRTRDLPPGPRPLPFIGNIHQIPLNFQERKFAEWGRIYDIVFVKLFSQPALIVNTAQVARELLEKRSAKYSNRAPSVLVSDLLGWKDMFVILPMGHRFRKQRRWMHSMFFAEGSHHEFAPVQSREVQVLLGELFRNPERFNFHLHRFVSSIMLERLYGHTVTSDDDEYVICAEAAAQGSTECATPGASVVDFLPLLRHVPAWMPGGGFKQKTAKTKIAVRRAHTKPYELVETMMSTGSDKPSLIRSLIEEYTAKGTLESEKADIMSVGAVAYAASIDTTHCVLQNFFLAMVLHPSQYAKAQEEVDRVIGNDRLPGRGDRSALPYLECLLREVYRWHCPVPLGVPHALSEDDEYRGYNIPKGCMIIPNLWNMTRDATLYPEPETFRPERFWGRSEEELERMCPKNVIFGHGRRICPGRRFADASAWLAMAGIIATFDIQKARDNEGKEITPPLAFVSGAVNHAEDFVCSITPRPVAAKLIATLVQATVT